MRLIKPTSDFTQVANAALRDPRLSAKAKGIYAVLFTFPDNWEFSIERLSCGEQEEGKLRKKYGFRDGVKALYTGTQELERLGYLERRKRPDGKMDYFLHLEDAQTRRTKGGPVCQNGEQAGGPNLPFGQVAKTGGIYNTIQSQNNNVYTPGAEKSSEPQDFLEFWSLYPKKSDKQVVAAFWGKMSAQDRAAAIEGVRKWNALWSLPGQDGFVIDPIRFLKYRRFDAEQLTSNLDKRLAAARAVLEREAQRAAKEGEVRPGKQAEDRVRREKKRKEEEEREAQKRQSEKEYRDRVLRFFEALPESERNAIEATVEESLQQRSISPEQSVLYNAARNSMIVMLAAKRYREVVTEVN